MNRFLSTVAGPLSESLRSLRRAPGFSSLVVVTLALGIGANAAMLSVLDELILRPPRMIEAPGDLYSPALTIRRSDGVTYTNTFHSYPLFRALRADTAAFSGVAMYAALDMSLGSGANARPVAAMQVSGDYFKVFGTQPVRGRFFLPDDDGGPSGNAVVVVSHRFWKTELGGSPAALGRTVRLDNAQYTVIGVAPAGFAGTRDDRADVWLPVTAARAHGGSDGWQDAVNMIWLQVVVRMRPGRAVPSAAASATLAARSIYDAGTDGATTATVALTSILPSRASSLTPAGRIALLLAVVSLFVLLSACANVANLTLARNIRREGEFAVRAALGMRQSRLVATVVAEIVILALVGGIIAFAVVLVGSPALLRLLVGSAPSGVRVDGRSLAMVSGLIAAVSIATGILPAIRAARRNLGSATRRVGRGATRGTRGARLALLAFQCASCVVLLTGSGAFAVSLQRIADLRLGFDPDLLWTGRGNPGASSYDNAGVATLQRNILGAARGIPGVSAAALASVTPMSGWGYALHVTRPGHDSLARFPDGGPYYTSVSGEYFRTMGTRIVRGRPILPSDDANGARVVVLNQSTASRWFPGEDPIGQCLTIGPASAPCTTVVGVAEDVRRQALVETGGSAMLYVPIEQYPRDFRNAAVVVRVSRGANPAPSLRRILQTAAPDLPYAQVNSMRSVVGNFTASWRLGRSVLTAFGLLALLIAAIGLYGAFSFVVALRSREIGIRMALGAHAARVLRMVLREGLGVAIAGSACGFLAVIATAPSVRPLLFHETPLDPVILSGVLAIILLMACGACLLPAVRAARVDPMTAIRTE